MKVYGIKINPIFISFSLDATFFASAYAYGGGSENQASLPDLSRWVTQL